MQIHNRKLLCCKREGYIQVKFLKSICLAFFPPCSPLNFFPIFHSFFFHFSLLILIYPSFLNISSPFYFPVSLYIHLFSPLLSPITEYFLIQDLFIALLSLDGGCPFFDCQTYHVVLNSEQKKSPKKFQHFFQRLLAIIGLCIFSTTSAFIGL